MANALFLSALMTLSAPAEPVGLPVTVDDGAMPVQVQATARARILSPVTLRRTGGRLIVRVGTRDVAVQTHRAPRADRVDAIDLY